MEIKTLEATQYISHRSFRSFPLVQLFFLTVHTQPDDYSKIVFVSVDTISYNNCKRQFG